MADESFSGHVLAGGKSSRMKTDKTFLKIADETFLERAVNVLKPICEDRISVMLNSHHINSSEKFPAGVLQIYDVYHDRGALGGIHAALKNCRTEWAIILAVDLPFVTRDMINFLANTALNCSPEIAAVIPQQTDGKWQPLCGIYRAEMCVAELENFFSRDEFSSSSVRGFLEKFPIEIVDAARVFNNAETLFLNVNTPADYEKLLVKK